jgi:hypothetical protein
MRIDWYLVGLLIALSLIMAFFGAVIWYALH